MPSPERLNLHEVAERLGVHYMTVYRYVRTGRLPAERDGAQWAVDPADVEAFRAPAAGRPPGGGRVTSPGELATRLVAGDEAGAWAIVEAAMASGVEPGRIHLDLLGPAMRSVGDGWESGRLSVADEHRATAVAQRLIGRLGPRFARPGRKRGTVVVGAPPGEEHGLPSAMAADLLRGAGYEVLDLGADAPAASFAETAAGANRLVAIVAGATTPGRDASIRTVLRAVRGAGIDAPVLVGGAAIEGEDHARRLGADGWSGPDGAALVAAVDALR